MRNVFDQGTSVCAWQTILDLYKVNSSVNSIVVTLIDIVETMESSGLRDYSKLPTWMEKPLWSLIALHGLKNISQYTHSNQIDTV